MTTILIADDHAHVRLLVKDYLTELGYRVITASDGRQALLLAHQEHPDLILLDVMMPTLDGLDFLRIFRRDQRIPVIVITARIEEADKVLGLELGADDYLTKPFGMQELVARIRAVLRRAHPDYFQSNQVRQIGDLVIDLGIRSVRMAHTHINLTPSEFDLLVALSETPGRVWTREQLLERLQGDESLGVERTIDVHIRNLRKKIEPDPAHPTYIETVFGVGYRCRVDGGVS